MVLGIFSKEKEDKKPKKTSKKVASDNTKKVDAKESSQNTSGEETKFYSERSVIKKPWVSEKAYELHENNKYVFLIENKATKNQVAREVQARWDVNVKSVRIIRKKKRRRSFRGKFGRQYTIKKAVVTVGENDKIDVYPV